MHKLIDTARTLEGMPRHASTHAAGVVITRRTGDRLRAPAEQRRGHHHPVPHDAPWSELGLLKMDFLGLRTLTVIRDTPGDDAPAGSAGL